MTEKTHRIRLVLGDWSHDGHGQTSEEYINSNLSLKQINAAYKKGTKKIGFDFCDTAACEYEDSTISKENFKALRDAGFDDELENCDDDSEEDGVSIWRDDFTRMYLFIVKLGNPAFTFTEAKDEGTIHVGGYGLFGN